MDQGPQANRLRAFSFSGAKRMTEPASSTVAGIAGWKAIGGAAGMSAGGAGLAAVVVMCMTPPRSKREWVVGIISTVLGSVCGGAFVIERWELQHWLNSYTGLVALLGMAFACGLPAWAIVRWTFNFIDRRQAADIAEVAQEVRRQIAGESANG